MLGLVELDEAAGRRVKGYSLGMRQRLGLAAALLGDPELLVLDEPANGLDPEGVRWLRDFLRAFAAEGGPSSSRATSSPRSPRRSTGSLIINHGRLVAEAPLAELTARSARQVRVRSPQAAELREALAGAGIESRPTATARCSSRGTTQRARRRDRRRRRIVLHELVTEGSSLEEVFLELTSERRSRDRARLRSELLKLRTTRTTLGLVLGLLALVPSSS